MTRSLGVTRNTAKSGYPKDLGAGWMLTTPDPDVFVEVWPLTKVSPFYGVISIEALHMLCLATAAVGALAFWLVRHISTRNADSLAKV